MDQRGLPDDVSAKLKLSLGWDLKATRLLDSLAGEFDTEFMASLLSDQKVVVFGCGPSLSADVTSAKASRVFSDYTVIAVDGATKALHVEGITPHIIVSDLDGDINSIIEASRSGSVVVLHGHGGNIGRIRKYFHHLTGRVYATTQRTPTKRVLNFGGFTDGDRAVYLAEAFKPKLIVLAGMDFGSKIGEYSGFYNTKKKLKKLEIGRKLLEDLAEKTRTPIMNMTAKGVELKHIPRITTEYLKGL